MMVAPSVDFSDPVLASLLCRNYAGLRAMQIFVWVADIMIVGFSIHLATGRP